MRGGDNLPKRGGTLRGGTHVLWLCGLCGRVLGARQCAPAKLLLQEVGVRFIGVGHRAAIKASD